MYPLAIKLPLKLGQNLFDHVYVNLFLDLLSEMLDRSNDSTNSCLLLDLLGKSLRILLLSSVSCRFSIDVR